MNIGLQTCWGQSQCISDSLETTLKIKRNVNKCKRGQKKFSSKNENTRQKMTCIWYRKNGIGSNSHKNTKKSTVCEQEYSLSELRKRIPNRCHWPCPHNYSSKKSGARVKELPWDNSITVFIYCPIGVLSWEPWTHEYRRWGSQPHLLHG